MDVIRNEVIMRLNITKNGTILSFSKKCLHVGTFHCNKIYEISVFSARTVKKSDYITFCHAINFETQVKHLPHIGIDSINQVTTPLRLSTNITFLYFVMKLLFLHYW